MVVTTALINKKKKGKKTADNVFKTVFVYVGRYDSSYK